MAEFWLWLRSTYWAQVVAILLLALVGGRWLGHFIRNQGAKLASKTDSASDDYLVSVVGYTVEWIGYGIGILTVLSAFNIDITPLITGAGFFGIVVGLAAREYLANVIAGLIIIADQPFRVGERVMLPKELGGLYGTWGDVVALGLRSTKILSTDGVVLSVPNNMLLNDVIVNFSHSLSPNLRVRLQVGVHPRPTNTKNAIALITEIINAHPRVEQTPRPPQIIIRELQPHEALIEARFYVGEPWLMRVVRSDIFEQFITHAHERKIRLSAPARRVYLHDAYEGAEEPPLASRAESGKQPQPVAAPKAEPKLSAPSASDARNAQPATVLPPDHPFYSGQAAEDPNGDDR
jgi:small-conductance mechanosensitive channel